MSKKFLPILLFISFLFPTNICAQIHGGAGIAFGANADNVGLQIRGVYELEKPWQISVDGIGYLNKEGLSTGPDYEWNANAHYKFITTDTYLAYGLMGFNFTKASTTLEYFGSSITTPRKNIGWNIGAGGQFAISKTISIVGELRYLIGKERQLVLGVSGLYQF